MKFLLGLILGIVVGALAWQWYSQNHHQEAQDAKNRVEASADSVKDYVKTNLNWKNIRVDDIKDEMAKTGKVIRQKTSDIGHAIADATADARITTAIKAKLVANPDLSALSISVNTTAGRVTLSGTVSSEERIREAILLAEDVDGVQEVVSTLQVKP